jgi:hypothetical protein
MQIETVAASWDTYRAGVVPADAGEEQIAATRAAFYAGAYFLLVGALLTIGDDSTSEDDGVAQLEAIKQEIEAFAISYGARLPRQAAVLPAPAADAVPEVAYTTADPENVRPILQTLGAQIASLLPPNWGYNLLLFPFGEQPGRGMFYVSNAERTTVLDLMREFLQRTVQ